MLAAGQDSPPLRTSGLRKSLHQFSYGPREELQIKQPGTRGGKRILLNHNPLEPRERAGGARFTQVPRRTPSQEKPRKLCWKLDRTLLESDMWMVGRYQVCFGGTLGLRSPPPGCRSAACRAYIAARTRSRAVSASSACRLWNDSLAGVGMAPSSHKPNYLSKFLTLQKLNWFFVGGQTLNYYHLETMIENCSFSDYPSWFKWNVRCIVIFVKIFCVGQFNQSISRNFFKIKLCEIFQIVIINQIPIWWCTSVRTDWCCERV